MFPLHEKMLLDFSSVTGLSMMFVLRGMTEKGLQYECFPAKYAVILLGLPQVLLLPLRFQWVNL